MRQEELRITLVQTLLAWEEKQTNIEHISRLVNDDIETDLIILPEMFNTGFTMNANENAEDMGGETVTWMKEFASQKNAVVTGSIIIKEDGKFFNRLIWAQPDGEVLHYDKRHLFRMANEHEHYTAGKKKIFPELMGWSVCPLVCYDLRFPVWSRNTMPYYDLLIYVANWPSARSYAWKTLLAARAMENQCYVAGVNRVGKDGKGVLHTGDSMLIDAKGNILSAINPDEEKVETITINYTELQNFRDSFPVFEDADRFNLSE